MNKADIEKVLSKVNDVLPPQPAIRLMVEKGKPGLFDSKLGGIPYFPKDMEYPRGKNNVFANEPMVLLAQLNFEKLPELPDFPTKGILQFFIAPDDLYGMSREYFGEALTRQDNFRIIYHKDIIMDEAKLLSETEIPKYMGDEECYLPFEGEYLLSTVETENMPATTNDFRFGDAFLKCYNEYTGENVENIWELDDEITDYIFEKDNFPDAIVGGYPIFTQNDPRYDDSIKDCDTLLFELDSVYDKEKGIDILWGDMGTGAFLIPRKNLKELDFTKVVYNYDCS
ncbi:MAG: DUF1963 domain-containing protein [Lachnospiraceae bacterium]|nr:DUF1963 domain-containing protein [Lachnospiraceae bacterium]